MNLTDEQKKEFRVLAKQSMRFLHDNCHQHDSISIDSMKVELKEGVAVVENESIDRNTTPPEPKHDGRVLFPAGMVVKYQGIPCRLVHDSLMYSEHYSNGD